MAFKYYLNLLFLTCTFFGTKSFEQLAPESKELRMPSSAVQSSTTSPTSPTNVNVSTTKKTYKQNPEIPCGLPPFVDQMPAAQREQLRKVWNGYVAGKDCGLQQAKTFEIVSKLSAEEKARIFGPPQPLSQSPTAIPTAAIPETAVAIIPMFIRTSPPHIKRMFDAILSNDTIDETDKFDEMQKLAVKLLNPSQMADFKLWLNSLKAQKAKIDARIDALSDEASHILKQITELRIKERSILQNMSPKIAAELTGLI